MTGASLKMTVEKAQHVPPVVDVPTAAAMLGIGRTAAYELIRLGKWPTPVLRLGKLIRIPSGPLLELIQGPAVKHGSVSQRHTRACARSDDGGFLPHRCKGSWQWVLEYGRDSSGGRLQTSKAGFPTKAAAQTALQQAVHTLMVDVNVTDLTVGDYLDTWLTGKHALKPKTVALYADMAKNYLIPHLGDVRLLELRAHHLDRMYAAITMGKRGRPLSPSTIRRVHAVLRSALNTAVKRRLLPYSPAEHIELAPENPKRPRPWTPEQCHTFLKHVADDRLAKLYQLMLVTGMRRGEAIGLRWENVDLDGQCLFVVQQITEVRGRSVVGNPKTKRGTRLVPVDDETVAMLRRHREGRPSSASPGDQCGTTPDSSLLARTVSPYGPSTPPGTSSSSPRRLDSRQSAYTT